MKIAVISPSTKSLDHLSAAMARAKPGRAISCHEGGVSRLRSVAEQERPDVVIVEGMCHDAGELAPVELVTSQFPQLFIIMLCTQQSSEMLINAMRVGVREVLPSPVAQEALEAALARAESKAASRQSARKAQFVAFVSCKGGSGATFLASNVSHQLAEEGKKVLLLDLNLQFGEAVLTLHDRKAASDIAQVARNLARLDSAFLNASLVQITPNLAILAAPDDPAQSLEVKPEHVDAILNLAASEYDYVVMDVSRNLDDLTIRTMDRADKIFLVTHSMLPYVRNANRMIAVFRSLGYSADKVEIVVNRYWRNGEIGLDEMRASLGVQKLRTVPNGFKEVSRAITLGVPLAEVSRSTPVFRAICEMAESLQAKRAEAPAGLLSRLLRH